MFVIRRHPTADSAPTPETPTPEPETPEAPEPESPTPATSPEPESPETSSEPETPEPPAQTEPDPVVERLDRILDMLSPAETPETQELETPASGVEVTPSEETAQLGEAVESAMPEPEETPENPDEATATQAPTKRRGFGRRR